VEELVAWILRVNMNPVAMWEDYIRDLGRLGHRARTNNSKPGMGKRRQSSG
jgi:hypothetical protein